MDVCGCVKCLCDIAAYGCPYNDLYDKNKPAMVTSLGDEPLSLLSSYSVNVSCPEGKLISDSNDAWVESTCNLPAKEWSVSNIRCQSTSFTPIHRVKLSSPLLLKS